MRSCRRNFWSFQNSIETGLNPEAGPMRRTRNFADRITGGIFGNGFLQRKAAFQRPRLLRCPGTDAAAAGARLEISVGLFVA